MPPPPKYAGVWSGTLTDPITGAAVVSTTVTVRDMVHASLAVLWADVSKAATTGLSTFTTDTTGFGTFLADPGVYSLSWTDPVSGVARQTTVATQLVPGIPGGSQAAIDGGLETVTGPGGVIGAVTGAATTWSLGAGNWFDCNPNVAAVTLTVSGFTNVKGCTGLLFLRPSATGTLTIVVTGGTVTPSTVAYTNGTPIIISLSSDDGGVTVQVSAPVTGVTYPLSNAGATSGATVAGVFQAGITGDTANTRAVVATDGFYVGDGTTATIGGSHLSKALGFNTNIGGGVAGVDVSPAQNTQIGSGSRVGLAGNIAVGTVAGIVCVNNNINNGWVPLKVCAGGAQTADLLALTDEATQNSMLGGFDATGKLKVAAANSGFTTATAGTNGAVPAQVLGYLEMVVGGTQAGAGTIVKVPYFSV